MGRYAYFSNGFEYKFWFAVQDSGFEFLEKVGAVNVSEESEYNFDEDMIENDNEHHFCDANCDKPIKNPKEMLFIGNCLFCDTECQQNFSGGEPNTPHDLDELEDKYRFLKWFNESVFDSSETFLLSDIQGIDDKWIDSYIRQTSRLQFELEINKDALLKYITETGLPVPDWDLYDKDTDGTDKMYSMFDDIYMETENESKLADHCLACILYHMSSYDDSITGFYEC